MFSQKYKNKISLLKTFSVLLINKMLLLKKSMYHVLILNQSFMIFPCRGKVVKAPLEARSNARPVALFVMVTMCVPTPKEVIGALLVASLMIHF